MYIMRFITFITLALTFFCASSYADEIDNLQLSENLVQLDGSASSDEDGDNLQYKWRQVAGPRVKLLNSDTAKPSFYAVVAGRYTFELVVSDGKAKSEPALVNVEVEKINHTPIAVLAKSISGKTNQSIMLDASSSADADGDALTYHWYQISGPTIIFRNKTTNTPFLNVSFKQQGVYAFELVADDGTAKSKPVRSVVKVVRPNSAPVARVINVNQKVRIRKNVAVASDYNQTRPAVRNITVKQKIVAPKLNSADFNFAKDASYKSNVRINNVSNSVKPKRSYVSNNKRSAASQQPVASTSGNRTVELGKEVVIKGFGVDPLNHKLKYYWRQTAGPKVKVIKSLGENISFIPQSEGIYIFELVVNNGTTVSKPAACAITVAKDVSGLMSLKGGNINDTSVNDVEIPGIEPVAVPTRRGGLLSKFFSDK